MAAVRWFRVPIWVGPWQQDVFLYQTLTNQFDFQYHWMYTGGPAGGLPDALRAFREGFARHHGLTPRGLFVKVGTPVEIGWAEVQAARPPGAAGPYLTPPQGRRSAPDTPSGHVVRPRSRKPHSLPFCVAAFRPFRPCKATLSCKETRPVCKETSG